MKYSAFAPNHKERLLNAIELAFERGHISESDYRSLKKGVEDDNP